MKNIKSLQKRIKSYYLRKMYKWFNPKNYSVSGNYKMSTLWGSNSLKVKWTLEDVIKQLGTATLKKHTQNQWLITKGNHLVVELKWMTQSGDSHHHC